MYSISLARHACTLRIGTSAVHTVSSAHQHIVNKLPMSLVFKSIFNAQKHILGPRYGFKITKYIQLKSPRVLQAKKWILWRNINALRVHFSAKRSVKWFSCSSLTFVPAFSLLRWLRKPDSTPKLSQDILDHIPEEVFKLDVLRKKPSKHTLVRLLQRIWEAVRFVLRFVRILVTFVPVLMLYPVTYLGKYSQRIWWNILLLSLEYTGSTFIKLGQWASTRRDIFPGEFCDLFSKLHYSTHVHPWHITKRKLLKAFGKRWREILVKVHKVPIGSGCIAQVHKAYIQSDMIPDEALVDDINDDMEEEPDVDFEGGLEILGFGSQGDDLDDPDHVDGDLINTKPDMSQTASVAREEEGQDPGGMTSAELQEASSNDSHTEEIKLVPVAVKVLHPGVYRAVKRDLAIIGMLTRVVEMIMPSLRWISLHECFEEFGDLMTKQIDLRFEAECLEQFVDNFSENPNIRFPRPVRPYCKRDVLVETYEEGELMSDFVKRNSETLQEGLREKLALFGIDALLQMIFLDNFVHGDLHPGNLIVQNAELFVQQDESRLMAVDVCDTVVVTVKQVETPLRLVMIDAGITTSLSDEDLHNFKAVFTAVVLGQADKVAELMLKHASYNECHDVKGFKKDLGSVVMAARQDTLSLEKIQVGRLLSDVFAVMSKHKVKLESNFASIVIAIFVLEGLGRSLDPEMDILERAKPILLA